VEKRSKWLELGGCLFVAAIAALTLISWNDPEVGAQPPNGSQQPIFRDSISVSPSTQFPNPEIEGGNVRVEYSRFTLIKHDDYIIALHILPDPRYGWSGITYRWYHLANGKDTFFRPSPEEADSASNLAVQTGSGEANEGADGSGKIHAGPLSIKWSKGSYRSGWLYLREAADVIQIYPQQFDRIDEFSGKLNATRWTRVY
jgi:hypothetical protein